MILKDVLFQSSARLGNLLIATPTDRRKEKEKGARSSLPARVQQRKSETKLTLAIPQSLVVCAS